MFISSTLSKQERSAFAQFTCGILPIRVAFVMDIYMNGFAPFVKIIFEDEEHFLVKCPLYTKLRKNYFYMFRSEHFDNNQYLSITLANDYPIKTEKFINSAFNLRKEMLYEKTVIQ